MPRKYLPKARLYELWKKGQFIFDSVNTCSIRDNVHPNSRLLDVTVVRQTVNQPPSAPSASLERAGQQNGCPYPLLNLFILGHCKRMCSTGGEPFIHYCSVSKQEGKHWVLFTIKGHRYCAKVNREHSHSNVRYVVDLKAGTFYQTCHSSKCGGYKSPAHPLPKEVWTVYR